MAIGEASQAAGMDVAKLGVDLSKPRWPQDTFKGRATHFITITNPLNILASSKKLEEARVLMKQYKSGRVPAGTTEERLWAAKHLYDSAFHPDTGEKMFILGRMSAQVPCNMILTGAMLTFYRSVPAVVFWQWFNQTFNATVNYTNRSGDSTSTVQLMKAYVGATTTATLTALGFNFLAKKAPPLYGRFVPALAVAAANCVNIPLMRQKELVGGILVTKDDGTPIGYSQTAARKAIVQVVCSRIGMAMPAMLTAPFMMQILEKKRFMVRMPYLSAPIQIIYVGFTLIVATPLCCALFPQQSSMSVSKLESSVQKEALKKGLETTSRVYFNKGL